jgi:pimeloyl-ACP methyl ester carboxylesterase
MWWFGKKSKAQKANPILSATSFKPSAQAFRDRRYQSQDGLSLYARDYEAQNGAAKLPIVCLHGLTRNSADFEAVAPYMAATSRRIVVPDIRGRGHSDYDLSPSNYHPFTYALDIISLCDHLGIATAHFIGTSMGGLITMVIATLRPTLIASAVLNDVGPYLSSVGLLRIAALAPPSEDKAHGLFKDWGEAIVFVKSRNQSAFPQYTDEDWQAFTKRLVIEDKGQIRLNYDPAIFDIYKSVPANSKFDMSPAYLALATGRPILLVRGALSDVMTAHEANLMQTLSPHMQRLELAHIGHAPMLSEPQAKAKILAFFSDQA